MRIRAIPNSLRLDKPRLVALFRELAEAIPTSAGNCIWRTSGGEGHLCAKLHQGDGPSDEVLDGTNVKTDSLEPPPFKIRLIAIRRISVLLMAVRCRKAVFPS